MGDTITAAQAAIQKKMLQSNPGITFGNEDYRGPAVGNAQTPGGVNVSITSYPSQTDSSGKAISGAAGMISKINQGLQDQSGITPASTPNNNGSWWDNIQQQIGSMGVGPDYGGGTYVPYSGQQLQFEKQQDTENQSYGQKYLDILSGKNTIAADKQNEETAKQNTEDAQEGILQAYQAGKNFNQVLASIQAQADSLTEKQVDVNSFIDWAQKMWTNVYSNQPGTTPAGATPTATPPGTKPGLVQDAGNAWQRLIGK